MKSRVCLFYVLAALFAFIPQLVFSQATTSSIEAELKSFLSLKKIEGRRVDEAYQALSRVVSSQKAPTSGDVESVVYLTIKLLHVDPSNYAIEVIYPFYQKNMRAVDLALKKASPDDQNLFKAALKTFERELREGQD